ncbi:uncharacterized protein PHACADRAFT_258332 [Phanerochaete carnosa HHB-10118-sp]|uniref:RING-type E3 ubiquitin transferase n=1 Tax=Phanerochaete carnosa (strain HHB-10118-sp) TaxID=650164 RepID=K5W5Q1_PHACS|nr:uncharacterized protein PHACADRAFT_258332 [Phanerochaete carnosa HHB-10118-sp]EKM54470.1 hypothetical protein PHACADRAFT_258332 [Phanerochaete carnosa HHB-10118-sp]
MPQSPELAAPPPMSTAMDSRVPSPTELEHALRRVRSENDLPEDVGLTDIPRRSHQRQSMRTHRPHLSEGHITSRLALQEAERGSTSGEAQTPHDHMPRRPTPVRLRDNAPRSQQDMLEILQGFENLPEDFQAELERARVQARQRERRVPPGIRGKILLFLGHVGPDAEVRSKLVSFVWSLSFGLAQFVVIVALLAYSSKHKSPTKPSETEWHACERPLGAWNAVWIVRNFLGCTHSYWTWRVELKRCLQARSRNSDSNAENGRPARSGRPSDSNRNSQRDRTSTGSTRLNDSVSNNDEQRHQVPILLSRLGNVTDMLGIVWFLTAHILVYTSIKTCRFSAPHLWWLSFSILCILYFMILEVFLVGLIVFIFWPVAYLTWNIFLLCIGRHPVQRTPVRHEIGKLPKSTVDQIPLVLYIPPPHEEAQGKEKDTTTPSIPYTYPPTTKPPLQKKRRFAFLRRSRKSKKSEKEGKSPDLSKDDKEGERTWEDNWVSGDYPFVRLEGNRAACAICLMDFEEPQRAGGAAKAEPGAADAGGDASMVQVDEVTRDDAKRLKLEDAGEGPQPLRLLGCGHVFHKTCVDPWLIDVSGRCPVCQRPVEIAKEGKGSG